MNLDARLIARALQDLLAALEIDFAQILMDSSFFSISFLSIAYFSKVDLRLELGLVKGFSMLELFSIKDGGED